MSFDIEQCSEEQDIFYDRKYKKPETALAFAMKDITLHIIKSHVMSEKERYVYESINSLRKSHKEVAEELNTSINDSRQTLHRANKKIHKVCESLQDVYKKT